MHDAHLALDELALIPLHDEAHDHVLDELSLRLSKLRLTVCYAEVRRDHSCDHPCGNELRLLCAAPQFVELLDDHHHGTNDRYLDDHDLLADDHDLPNHHGYKPSAHRDHRDQLTDDHYLGDRDLLEDGPLNHHGYKTSAHRGHRDQLTDDHDQLEDDLPNHHGYKTSAHRDHRDHCDLMTGGRDLLEDGPLNHHDHTTDGHRGHRALRDQLMGGHYLDDHDLPEDDLPNHRGYKTSDHRDLLTDDHDLGHHFVRMQDDLLDDYLDGMGVRHDLMPRGRDYLLDDPDCPKDGHYLDDHGLRLGGLNDQLHRLDVRDAKVCRILLPAADDVDRDFQGLALDEVYLQTTPKHRTYARWR
jgi:hypothetical protein